MIKTIFFILQFLKDQVKYVSENPNNSVDPTKDSQKPPVEIT